MMLGVFRNWGKVKKTKVRIKIGRIKGWKRRKISCKKLGNRLK